MIQMDLRMIYCRINLMPFSRNVSLALFPFDSLSSKCDKISTQINSLVFNSLAC